MGVLTLSSYIGKKVAIKTHKSSLVDVFNGVLMDVDETGIIVHTRFDNVVYLPYTTILSIEIREMENRE